ncbi:putative 3-beta hydroxysteroid dehydrogenase/isomerase, NAD(P)-binding domain superfamily [Helianthus debilis subsp. tardiflorus]
MNSNSKYVVNDPNKTQHLLALDGAKERLSLFEANLTVEGSFDSAVDGCLCVFHTASPVLLSVDDPQTQLIDPAVKGTLNVLKSAAKVQSLKRVVLTSSMSAVMFGSRLLEHGVIMDETWFSDPLICEQKKLWYPLSKILAEDAAVKFANENGLELVFINPGYVIGPFFQPTLNITSEGIMSLIKNAFENPEANGRYCMVGNVVRSIEIMKIVEKLYPSLGDSKRYKDEKCDEPLPYNVSREKAESLGVNFTPVEVSIKDTIESLKEKNLLSF